MSQFEGTAPYYAAYRPGIPQQAVSLLTGTVRGIASPTLLDLGSGTGQVPLALHSAFAEIDVVEADAGMIAEAEAALAPLAGPVVRFHPVRAEDFTPPTPTWRADLVTICRAFHWMDQEKVLSLLDECTAPDGAVVVMGDGSLWTARTTWTDALRALIQDYLGTKRRAGRSSTYAVHDRPYAEVLGESAFARTEEHRITVRRQWSPETVLGYLASTSFAARPLFGDRWEEFETQALQLLREHAQDDGLIEPAEFTVLIGRR
ncbi:class I SAM-dependent methyltransferase [Streptomyces mobaraensis]|uniref:Class I SAM-dependent methyltransferase n=1 Tax=Streptomyces mobaraensis TaxID=35621 RepID=A0A5N5W340_STRMB|nr:class I SAM-dependent methyltransferase [Streptomyces mobaraensis]KAB7835776.1 class I SAM-dependent methyltransferase [Streptomyces mobaraensis]